MTTKIANTFFFLLCISCYAAQWHAARGHNPSPSATEFVYNEEKMKQALAESGMNSSTWDDFNVYVGPQQGQKAANRIDRLPGQPKVDFNHYSGYVTVDDRAGKALFYYFVESDENPSAKPLLLWLNGGPGCSSLQGAMMELGPFRVTSDRQTLAINQHAWNKVANIIFLDSPVGVGFSYSNTTTGEPNDRTTAQDTFTFLINWLERFPEYKNQEFYIAGESYAGHYVPQLAKLILQKNNKASPSTVINLRGVVVGNGLIDDNCQVMGTYDFYYNHGMISSSVRDTLVACLVNPNPLDTQCEGATGILAKIMGEVNPYGINAPTCGSSSNISYPQHTKFDPCTDEYTETYLNKLQVQEALHAKIIPWKMCSGQSWAGAEPTILLTIKELMASGLRVWLFSGEMDGSVPMEATEYALKAMELSVKTDRYPWYNAPNEVGGYAIEYHNLTFVTVKDSGHFVPSYEPARALTLFSSFLQGALPSAAKS